MPDAVPAPDRHSIAAASTIVISIDASIIFALLQWLFNPYASVSCLHISRSLALSHGSSVPGPGLQPPVSIFDPDGTFDL
jgi:hypothetical protein